MNATPRRVLFLFPFPCLGGGGAQRVLSTLLRHLDRERFETHLALLQARRSEDNDVPEGVVVHDLDFARVRYALPGLVRLIRRIRPDVVLSNIGHMNLGLLLCRPLLPRSIKILIGESTTLGVYLQQATRHPALWAALYRRLYQHADTVICLSDAMKKELAEHFSVPQEKLVRIYNPVDVDRIRRLAELGDTPYAGPGPNLVAAGRFVREKGIDLLLDAMPRVRARFPHATLTLLGEGSLESELKEQAQKLDLRQAVSFPGTQANPWRYFRHADLVIVPSRVDGLPYVPLEALAVGTKVVATDCPGAIREAAEDNDGILLAPPGNPIALAEAIFTALNRPKLAHECPAQLGKFSLQRALEEYSALFEGHHGGER
jgi:glycosyltransferase involved in cell wall biosynthesis